jgi:hypothetical protein
MISGPRARFEEGRDALGHRHLAVREPVDGAGADRHLQLARDRCRQRWVGRTGKDRELSAHAAL